MHAYQIVDSNNPISVEYAALSKQSFQLAIDAGTITNIEDWQAVTPLDDDFAAKCAKYTWHNSNEQYNRGQAFSDNDRARMLSHFELLEHARNSMHRFVVMEHDAWLRDDPLHFEHFQRLMLEVTNPDSVIYANMGYKMCYYSITPHFADWSLTLLQTQGFPINSSTQGTFARLFATYTEEFLRERNYFDRTHTVLHPWRDGKSLGFSRDVYNIYLNIDPDPRYNWEIPVTQVIKRSLMTTVDNRYLEDEKNTAPWTRNDILHIID